jgi:hypothetical protein
MAVPTPYVQFPVTPPTNENSTAKRLKSGQQIVAISFVPVDTGEVVKRATSHQEVFATQVQPVDRGEQVPPQSKIHQLWTRIVKFVVSIGELIPTSAKAHQPVTAVPPAQTIQADSQASLSTNLVSYWKMDENIVTGTRFDSVGSNNLTDTNSLVPSSNGKIGKAVTIGNVVNSTPGYLTHPGTGSLATGNNSFSISGWYFITNPQDSQGIVDKSGNASNSEFEFLVLSNNEFTAYNYQFSWGTQFDFVTTDIAIIPDQWSFVTFGKDGNNLFIQVNLDARISVSAISPPGSGNPFVVGYPQFGTCFTGQIDELGFWNGRALTSAEHVALYNGGAGMTVPFP